MAWRSTLFVVLGVAVGCYPHPVDLPPSGLASSRDYFQVGSAIVTPPRGRWGFRNRSRVFGVLPPAGVVERGSGVEFCEVSQFGLILEGDEEEQEYFGWHSCLLLVEYPLVPEFAGEGMQQAVIDTIMTRWNVAGQTRKTTLLGFRMVDTHGEVRQIEIGEHTFHHGVRVRDEDPSKYVLDDWRQFKGEIVFRFAPNGALFVAELHEHHLEPGGDRWQVLESLRWPER